MFCNARVSERVADHMMLSCLVTLCMRPYKSGKEVAKSIGSKQDMFLFMNRAILLYEPTEC